MVSELRIELERVDEKVILRIEGKLDATSTPILEKKINTLIGEGHVLLLLDFTRIDYLSSAGMRLLLSFTKRLKTKKGFLVIFSLHDDVMGIIKMAGFDRILHICSTEQQALRFSKD